MLSDRIEELANLIDCIVNRDCMLEGGHPGEDDCYAAQGAAAADILKVLLPVLRAAVAYVEAWRAEREAHDAVLSIARSAPDAEIDAAFDAWEATGTAKRLAFPALVAAVEEAQK